MVTQTPPFPLPYGPVKPIVSSEEHHAGVVAGLERARIPVAAGPGDVRYMLKVEVGKAQTPGESCGRLRNVRYILHYAAVEPTTAVPDPGTAAPLRRGDDTHVYVGARALEIVGKGRDGSCEDGIFTSMALALRQQMKGR